MWQVRAMREKANRYDSLKSTSSVIKRGIEVHSRCFCFWLPMNAELKKSVFGSFCARTAVCLCYSLPIHAGVAVLRFRSFCLVVLFDVRYNGGFLFARNKCRIYSNLCLLRNMITSYYLAVQYQQADITATLVFLLSLFESR